MTCKRNGSSIIDFCDLDEYQLPPLIVLQENKIQYLDAESYDLEELIDFMRQSLETTVHKIQE